MIEATTRIKQLSDEDLSAINIEGIMSAFKASGQPVSQKELNDINAFMLPYLRESYSSLHACFLQKAYKNGIIGEEKYATGKLCPALFLKWINQISSEMLRAHQQEAEYESIQRRRQTIDAVKPTGRGGLAFLLRYYYMSKNEEIPPFEKRLQFVDVGKNDKGVTVEVMLATGGNPDWGKLVNKKKKAAFTR